MSITRRSFVIACAASFSGHMKAVHAQGSLADSACPDGKVQLSTSAPSKKLPEEFALPIDIKAKLLALISKATGFTEKQLTETTNTNDPALKETRQAVQLALAPLTYVLFDNAAKPAPNTAIIRLTQDGGRNSDGDLSRTASVDGIVARDYALHMLGINRDGIATYIAVRPQELLKVVQDYSGDDLMMATIGGLSRKFFPILEDFIRMARLALVVGAADDAVRNYSLNTSRLSIAVTNNGCVSPETVKQLNALPTSLGSDQAQEAVMNALNMVITFLGALPQTPTRARSGLKNTTTSASPR